MQPATLTESELMAITGYQRPACQLRELQRQGFWRARRSRITGKVILERTHYDAVCRGETSSANDTVKIKPLKLAA